MNIERYIQQITHDGKTLVDFLAANVQGNTQHATVSHRLRSVEWLAALGGFIPEDAIPKYASVRPRPKSEPQNGKRDKSDKKPKATEKQILHFDIARLIKRQTQDGKTAIDFLARVVAKGERPKSGENFTVAARMRATRELLIRGFGNSAAYNCRILSGDTEDLGSDLAKRIRGCTNDGAELVHLLVNALENKNPEAASKGVENPYPKFERQRKTKPAEGFTASQRVWSACELLRRAYDIRTDHITPDDIQAYWKSQTSAANNAAADSSPDANRTGITPKDIQAETPTIARSSKVADNAATRDKNEKRPAAAKEKPDADNTLSDTPDRAARRRQKRAARKAQKRAANTRPDTPVRSVYPEDIADIEAYKQRLQAKSDAIRDAKLRNADIRKIPGLKRHITPEEVAAFQRQPGNLYNRTREMYKEKYGEYPFLDNIPANARSP